MKNNLDGLQHYSWTQLHKHQGLGSQYKFHPCYISPIQNWRMPKDLNNF